MIEQFKDNEIRNTGIIYSSTFEQIKKLYAMEPEQAGEFAIAAIELVLTGEISSDDYYIELMLEPTKISVGRNQAKYDQKVENSKSKKIAEQKLEQIADLSLKGYKQREIAERLGLTQQMVSYRLGVIKTTYPELLQKNEPDLPNTYKNTKLTKDTKVCTDDSFVKTGEEEKVDEEPAWKKEFSF